MRPKMDRPKQSPPRRRQQDRSAEPAAAAAEEVPPLPRKMDRPQTSAQRFAQKRVRSDGLIPSAARAVPPVSNDAVAPADDSEDED